MRLQLLLLALHALGCSGKESIMKKRKSRRLVPQFTWSQNATSVVLRIQGGGCAERFTAITPGGFHLRCGGAKPRELKFEIREDVVAADSSCAARGREEVCVLRKLHRHAFDRLTVVANPAHLQGRMTYGDFDGLIATEGGAGGAAQGDAEEGGDVLIGTERYAGRRAVPRSTLGAIRKSLEGKKPGTVVLADVFFPWCQTCATAAKDVDKLAKAWGRFVAANKDEDASLSDDWSAVHVDAREDREAARESEVGCAETAMACVLQVRSQREEGRGAVCVCVCVCV